MPSALNRSRGCGGSRTLSAAKEKLARTREASVKTIIGRAGKCGMVLTSVGWQRRKGMRSRKLFTSCGTASFVPWPFDPGEQLGKGQFEARQYCTTEE